MATWPGPLHSYQETKNAVRLSGPITGCSGMLSTAQRTQTCNHIHMGSCP